MGPGIDDGVVDPEMARVAVAKGIRAAIVALQAWPDERAIDLKLAERADAHWAP